jgi:hypothetical protein
MRYINLITLLLIGLFEGSALMALELITVKLVAPYYGTSVYVWATVFSITLGGLALGYALGGRLCKEVQNKIIRNLTIALGTSTLLLCLVYHTAAFLLEVSTNLSMIPGLMGVCLVIITPVLICFGTVSPILIQLLNIHKIEAGKSAGLIYAISTLGGVFSTFYFGFELIPFSGLKFSLIVVTLIMFCATLLSIFIIKKQ